MTCKVVIELEIEGDLGQAIEVVEALLDWGTIQEEINDWDRAERPLLVTSATVRPA